MQDLNMMVSVTSTKDDPIKTNVGFVQVLTPELMGKLAEAIHRAIAPILEEHYANENNSSKS